MEESCVGSNDGGELFDPDLSLYYLRDRHYSPATGRFMSRDPEDGVLTDPATLHKYAYANGNPVNGIDPTGRSVLMEHTETTVKIDMGALPAIAATGCAVNFAYNVIALKVANDFDITPTSKCGARGRTQMRIQLQKGTTVTIEGTPVLMADDPLGVTTANVYAGLLNLWGLVQSGQTDFPKNKLQRDLRSAIVEISECVKRQSGTLSGWYQVCQAYVTGDQNGWRIDLENVYGVNLRQ